MSQVRKLKDLSDTEIYSYFESYMSVGFAGIIKKYSEMVEDAEKEGNERLAKRLRKTKLSYEELRGMLNDYKRHFYYVKTKSIPKDSEELKFRLGLLKDSLKLSKNITHFKVFGLKGRNIDSLTSPRKSQLPVSRDDPFSGTVWWPGLKQVLTEMNVRLKGKMDSLENTSSRFTDKKNSTNEQKVIEDKFIKTMNQLKMETILNIVSQATIAQRDSYVIQNRLKAYQEAYKEFCSKVKKDHLDVDISVFTPQGVIDEANRHIAENMIENKEKYAVSNDPSDVKNNIVSRMLTATTLMDVEKVGSIYRGMVEAYSLEGAGPNDVLQANFISTIYNMMKRTGKLSERQGLTVETANRICRDVLQAEPIFKRESFGQFKGSVNTNK